MEDRPEHPGIYHGFDEFPNQNRRINQKRRYGRGTAINGIVGKRGSSASRYGGYQFHHVAGAAAAYAIAAIIFYFGYKINDKDIVRMQEEIAARTTSSE